ncbi:hypothetical protein BUL40_00505 [Croceivirga radicis]|uniref:DUF3078 domain-containing protein n=1 Tax=Croceivirga radicis TaxID=1929488 RepID=A0A1V6LV80_9FLAO|nr:DUF3078 domain-containing protein [Croceivirga radicis]OQD44070.1 hypothetical protein BUL40_00505 [Croceivirga radicis]
MTRPIKLFTALFLFIGIFAFGQEERETTQDSTQVAIDSMAIDTIVIRWEQKKIDNIKKGVDLRAPKVSFLGTKPLNQRARFASPTSFWENSNQFNLDITETAFVNWNAGGENAVSALGNLNFTRKYKFAHTSWDNELRLRYGINAQKGRKLRKTDDFIKLTSTFGFRKDSTSKWFWSAKLNFNTQFSNGYKYPDRSTPISRFMAPGYLLLGAGTTFNPEGKKFELYLSPITQKATFVLDDALSQQGAFGVNPGDNVFMQFGFLLTNNWEEEIFTNIFINHRLSLYTDYINSFGNIDVDWEINFLFKVNKFIQANISGHLIYDDDIKFDEVLAEDGSVVDPGIPKIQFKQSLGLGLIYTF